MPSRLLPILFIICILLSSCAQQIVSPLNTTTNPYIPNSFNPTNDGSTAETYVGIGFAAANASSSDKFFLGSASLAQSRSYKFIRANYAVNLMMGTANVDTSRSAYRHENGGKLFSGAYGANGSLSFVIPHKNNVEWRVLGLTFSGAGAFGKYADFRKSYPENDSIYSYYYEGRIFADRNKAAYSAGLFSEFEVERFDGGRFGFRLASSLSQIFKPGQDSLTGMPYYTSATLFFSKKKYHGYIQTNFGTGITGVQLGLYYMLNSTSRNSRNNSKKPSTN